MKITNTQTGTKTELSLIDPVSGSEWIGDSGINEDDTVEWHKDDNGDNQAYASTESIQWWVDYVTSKQAADDRAHNLRVSMDNHTGFDNDMADAVSQTTGMCDEPQAINNVCDRWEAK